MLDHCATTLPQKRGDGIKTSDNFNCGTNSWSHCYYNSLVGSYAPGMATWTDNIVGFDPKFVNPRAMDYRLRADSPCRGAGAAWNGNGTTDLDGKTIPSEGAPDIGCYQYDSSYVPQESVLYVATTGDDANDGSDAAHAFETIPAAYAAATDGTEIRVGPGTYTLDETLVLNKKVTVIGAGIDKSVITTSGPCRPVSLENDFTLVSGFTFADIPYDGPQVWNGGVMRDCTVACNAMAYAVWRTSYGLQIANCIVRDRDNGETKCWYDGASPVPADRWLYNCTPVEVGTGCVTNNPLFKKVAKNDFNLLSDSPCIGAAVPEDWLMDARDLNGRPRVSKDGTQDIGCYQLRPSPATTISFR